MSVRDKMSFPAAASCEGKRAYTKWSHAQKFARLTERKGASDNHVAPYSCKHCGKYHVGHHSDTILRAGAIGARNARQKHRAESLEDDSIL